MSRWAILAACLFLLGALAPRPAQGAEPTPSSRAGQVAVAVAADDGPALAKLAAQDHPDPWLVVEALLVRAEADAAVRFAAVTKLEGTAGLGAYITKARATAAKNAGADVTRVRALYEGGIEAYKQERHTDACRIHEKAAAEATAMGWLTLASEAHSKAGDSYWIRSDYRSARQQFLMNLAMEQRIGSAMGTGRGHFRVAITEDVLGNPKASTHHMAEARRLARSSGDDLYLAKIHGDDGMRLGRQRHAQEAIAALKKSRELLMKMQQDHVPYRFRASAERVAGSRSTTLLNLASMYALTGDAKGGREFAREAVDAARELGIRRRVLEARGFLALLDGAITDVAGEKLGSLSHYRRAVRHYRQAGSVDNHAHALRRLAAVKSSLADLPSALEDIQRAIALLEAVGAKRQLMKAHEVGRSIALELGRPGESLRHAETAWRLARELDEPDLMIDAQLGLSGLARSRVEYGVAARHLREAARIAAEHPKLEAIVIEVRQAQLRADMGDAEGALALAEALLPRVSTYQQSGNRRGVQRLIGRCHLALGNYEEAEKAYRALLETASRSGDRGLEVSMLKTLSQVAGLAGRYEEGIAHAERAVGLAAASRDTRTEINMRVVKGWLQAWHGDRDDALDELEFALGSAEEIGDVRLRASALTGLAEVRYIRKEFRQSMARAREGVELGARYGLERSETSRAMARLQFNRCARWGAAAAARAGSVDDLYYFLERLRAGSVTASLGGRARLKRAHVPEDLSKAVDQARAATAMAYERWTAAKRRRKFDDERAADAAYRRALSDEREAIEAVQGALRARAGLADLARLRAMTAVEAQSMVAEGDAFVILGVDGWHYLAVVLLPTKRYLVRLGTIDDVNKAVEDLLEQPDSRDRIAALRKVAYDGLALPTTVKRVLISPARKVSYAPFSAVDPGRQFAFVPSASAWSGLRRAYTKRGDEVLAMADPSYDTKVVGHPDLVIAKRGSSFTPLPKTREEAQAVGDVVFLGAAATETRLRSILVAQKHWRSVHLACHGVVDDFLPTRSALVLSRDAQNDGFLHADEIHEQMRFSADMVVLSACETGRGRIFAGEGLLGLSRSFMLAGTPRVLCSLWKVDDEATAVLMKRFYKLWNPPPDPTGKPVPSLSPTAALQQAQAHVRSHKKWKDPQYWAAWVLWGLPD